MGFYFFGGVGTITKVCGSEARSFSKVGDKSKSGEFVFDERSGVSVPEFCSWFRFTSPVRLD